MNTDKYLTNKFCDNKNKYPIWYYKQLEKVEVDYVIWNLLKQSYIVEINGSKHEITFGKNRKHEIGQCIKYDDIKNSGLCSFQVVERGFREGTWYTITDIDTTEEFKQDYIKRKQKYEIEQLTDWYREILVGVVEDKTELNDNQKVNYISQILEAPFEELEDLVKYLIKNNEENNVDKRMILFEI